jgi:ABC-type polysaccharide/polyol phosphate export permease
MRYPGAVRSTTAQGASNDVTVTTITQPVRSTHAPPSIDLAGEATSPRRLAREMWRARELLVILARKEFHVRYRRASFGILWAVALPLLQSVVMAVVFSRVAHFNTKGLASYGAFVLTGMAPWTYFTIALVAGSTAIVDNTELSSKVYFPRPLLPLTQVVTALYGYGVTLAIVLILCPILHVSLGWAAFLVIPGTLLMLALACGFVLVVSALHVYFRDVKYLVSAAFLVWMYVTPIIYPPADAPRVLRAVIDINPLTGVVDLFHAATVGHYGYGLAVPLIVTAAWTVALLVGGLLLQCRFNRVFSDLL